MGGLCKSCMQLICAQCLDQGCKPLEKWLEEQERAITRRLVNDRRVEEYRSEA